MTTLIIIHLYLIWILFAVVSAFSESEYFVYKYSSDKKFSLNPHIYWTIQRVCLGLVLTYILFLQYSWYAIFGGLAMVTLFPFFHDGFLYYNWNRLDNTVFKLGFKDVAEGKKTWLPEVDYIIRLVLATIYTTIFILLMIKL